ncbi:hypothetical protein DI272_43690 [Streptomyces sp. Act143]|nr:hypothetical protein DI272_43690 [Streptomyces sp. Act143]
MSTCPSSCWARPPRFQSVKNPSLYPTGASADAPLTLENVASDGSQDWGLVPSATPPAASAGRNQGGRSPRPCSPGPRPAVSRTRPARHPGGARRGGVRRPRPSP